MNFEFEAETKPLERLLPEQIEAAGPALSQDPAALAAALNTTPEAVEFSKAEGELMSSPFDSKDVTMAKGMLIALATMGSTEAIRFRAACKIIDSATVSAPEKLRAKLGVDKHTTINNIIVAANKARELSDRQ